MEERESCDDNKSTSGPPARQLYKGFWLKLTLITGSAILHLYTDMKWRHKACKESRTEEMRIAEKEKMTNKVLRDGAQLCFCWKLCMRKSCVCVCERDRVPLIRWPVRLSLRTCCSLSGPSRLKYAVLIQSNICFILSYQDWPLVRWPSWA